MLSDASYLLGGDLEMIDSDHLDGHSALDALKRLLDGRDTETQWAALSPAIDRLRLAIVDPNSNASPLDLAVLLRQALLYEFAFSGQTVFPTVRVSHPKLAYITDWSRVGLSTVKDNGGLLVTLKRWQPSWLDAETRGADEFAASETIKRKFNSEDCTGDPMLKAVGRTSYRSRGQRAAVRAALTTPAGGSLIIALPTGEGKSMIFQLIQKVGFIGPAESDAQGVTLVIVPTVALGVNHEQEAVKICGLTRPLAFQGGNDAENRTIVERISNGTQGLCFSSPEAACGRLRESLRRAAEAGNLRAIVIDEAHLVDQWGTGFRTEFQELSGLRRELLAAAPPGQALRTIMLSATLTDASRETLRSLFGADEAFASIAAVQLRPEPDYWVASTANENKRIDEVMEALFHLPRPLVLYVTEVDAANQWHQRLIQAGFKRVRKLHGKTVRVDREEIVSQWRDGKLDIVVGTSAFGLGIDYAHCRSVVHACVPETLDRFYQEVGRGGRDGKAAVSLIIPTEKDFAMAERINSQQVISVERGFQRWKTMFERKRTLPNERFIVRIDGRPGISEADIDMFGDANTDWNLRTLALLARGGIIRLLGTPYPPMDGGGDWLEIEIIDDRHLDIEVWREKVEAVRTDGWIAAKRNLDLMQTYLSNRVCPAEVLEDLYGRGRIGRMCSRCRLCRDDEACQKSSVSVGEPLVPWFQPLDPRIQNLFDRNLRLLVTYEPEGLTRNASRRLGETLQRLQQAKLAKLIILGDHPFDIDKVLKFAETTAFFVSRPSSLARSRLPTGPEVVLLGSGQKLYPQNLTPRPDNPRIFMAPVTQGSPDGRKLKDVFGGRTLTFDEFYARVAQ